MEELLKLHLQKMLPWQKMQYKTYLRWVNHFLVNKDLPEITFLEEAVEDGIILTRILEHYSGKQVAGLQNPARKSQMSTIRKIDNLTRCFAFMKQERVPMPQFEPTDIEAKNLRFVFGILWAVVMHYQILDMVFTDGKHRGTQLVRERLLELLRECLGAYPALDLNDMRRGSFIDGMALSALVHYHKPALLDYGALNRADAKENLNRVFDVLFQHFDVPRLLDADDLLAQEPPDETSVMIYLAITLSTLAQASERSASVASAPETYSGATARPALLRVSTHTKFVREEQLDDILNSMFASPANSKGKTLTQTMKRQATLERNSVGVGVHKFDQLIRSQVPKPSAQSVVENKPPERRAALAERLQLVDYTAAAASFHAPILASAAADVDKIKVILEELTAFGSGPPPDPSGLMKAGTGPAVLVTQHTCKAAADALRGMLKPLEELVRAPTSVGARTGREADEIALGVPLFAANLLHELARAGSRMFDLSNCIACVRRLVGMVRTVMTLTKDGISQFEAVNYAKNFLVQTVQLVVVLGVVAQTQQQRSPSAAPPQTLTAAVKNVVNAMRKLLCAVKLTADQELRQKQRLRSLFSELDRSSGRPLVHAPTSPSASPLSASPLSPSSPSPLSAGSPLAQHHHNHTQMQQHHAAPARPQSPQRHAPAPAAAPLLPPPSFPAPVPPSAHSQSPSISTASIAAVLPLASPNPSPRTPAKARRSSRSRTYDRLIARLAEDCRLLTVELKPNVADFHEKRFADALSALLATHRSAVGILTVYLGSGSALKRLLVAGTALDMAANEVVINAAPPGALYGKARHNFKICLKDFLATIRASTLLLSAAASPRTTEQTNAPHSSAVAPPSSPARYTLTPSHNPANNTAAAAAAAATATATNKPTEEAARKGQIQRVSTVAQGVIRALRGPLSPEFLRNFDFAIVQELLKTLATLLSSLRVEDKAVRVQLVEATKALVQHSKRLKAALDVRSLDEFLAAKAPFLTALKAVLTTLLTLARQRPA